MQKRYSVPALTLLAIALLLVLGRLALPYLVRDYLNAQLADMGAYRGHLDDVDLALWRGAYKINGLVVEKARDKASVPLLQAPLIDIAVSWHTLWYDHAIAARVEFVDPKVHFVDGGEQKAQSQTGEGVDWRQQLEKLLPITLNEIKVTNGQLAFHNFTSDPPVNLYVDRLDASFYNLTNTADANGRRVAEFKGSAQLLDQAPLEASARFDPFSGWENFELRLRLTDLELTKLNAFTRAYAGFDFHAGSGDLVLEAEAENSQLGGYIKPLLHNVDIFYWGQDVEDPDKGILHSLWEAVVGGGQAALKNQHQDQFATRIELSGSIKQSDISPFQAFLGILRNAFVQAFSPRFERSLQENGNPEN